MASGLQCPGCGHVHPSGLPEIARGDATFRCYGCYRTLSVPEGWSGRPAPRPAFPEMTVSGDAPPGAGTRDARSARLASRGRRSSAKSSLGHGDLPTQMVPPAVLDDDPAAGGRNSTAAPAGGPSPAWSPSGEDGWPAGEPGASSGGGAVLRSPSGGAAEPSRAGGAVLGGPPGGAVLGGAPGGAAQPSPGGGATPGGASGGATPHRPAGGGARRDQALSGGAAQTASDRSAVSGRPGAAPLGWVAPRRSGAPLPKVVRAGVWAAAFGIGLLVTAFTLRKMGILDVNRVIDLYAGSGPGRFGILLLLLPMWALLSATIAHLSLEALAKRRRPRPTPSRPPVDTPATH